MNSQVPTIEPASDDDPAFVAWTSRVLDSLTRKHEPQDIFVIQIDHWFGHMWKEFSLRARYLRHKSDSLIMPPFHPHRVKSQLQYSRIQADGLLYGEKQIARLHLSYRSTPDNRYLPIRRVTDSGMFVWYTGNTKRLDRASLMVYRTKESDEAAWYVSLLEREEWRVELAEGISHQELMQLASEATVVQPSLE